MLLHLDPILKKKKALILFQGQLRRQPLPCGSATFSNYFQKFLIPGVSGGSIFVIGTRLNNKIVKVA